MSCPSNLSPEAALEQWVQVCGSERLTGAMLDRLTHRLHIVEANGQSYRLRDSQRRLRCQRKAQATASHRNGRQRIDTPDGPG